jgi:hypothetical protein
MLRIKTSKNTEELEKMTIKELRQEMTRLDIWAPSGTKKAVLVERLVELKDDERMFIL